MRFGLRTDVIHGPGSLGELAAVGRELGFRRTLLVVDAGVDAAHGDRARALWPFAATFSDFGENPDSAAVERGRVVAAEFAVDSIVGLGGGSSLDCAKAINFVVTNGGRMEDYAGWGKAAKPMLPSIGIPTTAGTGSEAQSYTLISDPVTHVKMACGDSKSAFRVAILDPELEATAPERVKALARYDAISHAVETWVSTKRTRVSEMFSREAWSLLMEGEWLLGAHLAGAAIENSMLGAAHACANPLTARYGTPHGAAIAGVLAHVVRWNGGERYAGLDGDLAARVEHIAGEMGLATRLRDLGVVEADFPALAAAAAPQWTGRFNPRPFDEAGALEIYRCAY